MTLNEFLLPYSIENFLTEQEANRILGLIDQYKLAHPARLAAGVTGASVHLSDAVGIEELVAIYEPKGRIEINTADLPGEAIDIMETAYFRHIENIRRAYPSATWPYGFAYVEYGPGQFFTPHADGIMTVQCAGFGVTLTDDFTNGEFCVETCGSNQLWVRGPNGDTNLAPGADSGSEWFRKLPRTRWSAKPERCKALFYGSALVHCSEPVTAGSLKKMLAFIANG